MQGSELNVMAMEHLHRPRELKRTTESRVVVLLGSSTATGIAREIKSVIV
jgi:hypothetical protein